MKITNLTELPVWVTPLLSEDKKVKKWEAGMSGVGAGSRNDTATSMAGKILSSTDPKMWDSIGYPTFQAWNNNNKPPLDDKELENIWSSIKKLHIESLKKEAEDDSVLHDLCSREDVVLFHDEQGNAHISQEIGGHQETWACKSKSMKRLLAKMSWDKSKKPLSGEKLRNMITVLEGLACFDGPEIKLENRVALNNDGLWYDLTNKEWQAIQITKEGWKVVDKPPILFKKYSHHKAQVIPTPNGDVKKILEYINISNEEHKMLFLIFLVSCFIPNFPHAMLMVFGAQGSSKSTLSKLARLLIDPSIIEVVGFPTSTRELIQVLAHHYFLFFDNVSFISEESSDTLCKAITGSGFSKRELYENDEDIIYSIKRCIGVNGINLVATRPDLLERSILLELERVDHKQRKSEGEIYEKFKDDLPSILGGVFDVLVKTLKRKPLVQVEELPRMADFTLWGVAIAESLGYTKEEFLLAYKNNIRRQTEMLLNDNVVANAVITFLDTRNTGSWIGTASRLLENLVDLPANKGIDTREKYWPKGANQLSRRLNELSTSLKQVGITVVVSTDGTNRSIHLYKDKFFPNGFTNEEVKAELVNDGSDDAYDVLDTLKPRLSFGADGEPF